MLRNTSFVCAVVLSGLLTAHPASAEESATLVMKSGERVGGELVDQGATGFVMRVNGQSRRIAANDVAVVEFTGGAPQADVLAKLRNGQQIVVLRNGQVVEGRLTDVGGTRPLRISVDTPSGSRNFNSNEVAQIFLALPPGAAANAPSNASEGVRVDANQAWVDTGVDVARGDRVVFGARGDIMIAPGASAGVGGTPALQSTRYPLAGAPAGALIGRVGNGAPFLIGSNTSPIAMPADGRLMVGINDDNFSDNTGSFSVKVDRQPSRRLLRR